MSKLSIAKTVINVIVGSSAAYCTSAVIESAVEPESTEEKVKLAVGSIVIGSMVASQAKQHVDNGIDSVVEIWQNRKSDKTAETVTESAA